MMLGCEILKEQIHKKWHVCILKRKEKNLSENFTLVCVKEVNSLVTDFLGEKLKIPSPGYISCIMWLLG